MSGVLKKKPRGKRLVGKMDVNNNKKKNNNNRRKYIDLANKGGFL